MDIDELLIQLGMAQQGLNERIADTRMEQSGLNDIIAEAAKVYQGTTKYLDEADQITIAYGEDIGALQGAYEQMAVHWNHSYKAN